MKKLLSVLALVPVLAFANPFTAGTTLYGDPRAENPDGLQITVLGEVTGDTGTFSVDLSPMAATHPDVLLGEFYFSLVAPASAYLVEIQDPANWSVSTPASVVGGGNNAGFLFENSGPNSDRPDIDNPLLFTVQKLTGDFLESDFENAATFSSNDVILGGGQLGAHLQSLSLADCSPTCTSDSGFVLGDWTTESVDPTGIASPGTMALLGLGLVGLGLARHKRR